MIEKKIDANIEVMKITISPPTNDENGAWIEENASKIGTIGKNPLVYYNGILINENYIESFYLNNENFFPILQLNFSDETSIMNNNGFALDNTIISIFIDSRTKNTDNSMNLRPIRMDFKIVDYLYNESSNSYYVQGVPNVDKLYLQNIKSYPDMTSFNVLQEISKELKLGYRSNISDTTDTMKWSNMNLENYEFIKNTTKNSYKSDKSFFTSYIDYYYNLNFIDVEKAMSESLDVKGILTHGDEGIEEGETQEVSELYIMSEKFHSDTKFNNIYETFEVLNKSTKISLNKGYRTNLYYYDKTANWEQKAGTFLKFNLETNTNNKGIVLKSNPNDTEDNGFFKTNTKSKYLPSLDVDNTHKNYNFAEVLNENNLIELDKVTIKIKMREPNFNFYRFQKIKVYVMSGTLGSDILNKRLSGGWLIKGINFYYDSLNSLKQELIMIKRELSDNDLDF